MEIALLARNVLLLGKPLAAPASTLVLGDVPRRLAEAGWAIAASAAVRARRKPTRLRVFRKLGYY